VNLLNPEILFENPFLGLKNARTGSGLTLPVQFVSTQRIP
jgi:hypothetical protein